VAWRRSVALLQAKEEEETCCDPLVFSNKKFCLWFSLAGVAEETKS
jgi:hypothetical protein